MKLSTFTVKVLTASLILASTTGLAFAKNYKGEKTYKDFKDEAPCPPVLVLKDGFYVGAQVGYDSYRVRESMSALAPSLIYTSNVQNATGWLGGLFLGYGQNLNNWFYLGGEVFVNTSNAQDNLSLSNSAGAYTSKFEVNSSYGISLLPGVKVTESLLSYLRLGWNWANLKVNETASGNPATSKSNTSNGFDLGLGLETLLMDNWSVRGEYSHTWYNSFNTGYGTSVNPSDNQFTVGLNYHFA